MSVALNTLSSVPAASTPSEARGVLVEASASKVVVSFPASDYQLHLAPERPVTSAVGKRVLGIIKGQARRIDALKSGGQFVEPVMGRPRIVQGRVVEVNTSANGPGTVTVACPMPIVLKVGELQRAEQFKVGDLVTTHVLPGATFTPLG